MPEIFHLRPVFTVLNKKILSFFEGEHVTNLYSSIRLSKVLRAIQPPVWNASNIFCFEVLKNPKQDKRLIGGQAAGSKVGLCAQSQDKMYSWMEAIEKFENCEVEEYVPTEEGDEQVVKSSVQVRKLRNENKEANKIAALDGDAQREEEAAEKEKQEQEAEMDGLRSKLKDIKSEMTKKNIEDQRERLRLMEERKRQENLRDFLHKEEDCLTEDLNKKAEDGASRAETFIKGLDSKMIGEVIDSTKDNMLKEADKTRLLKQGEEVDIAEAERKMNEKMKNFLVQETLGFELIMDAAVCYSNDLAFNPKSYIMKACADMQEPGKVPNMEDFKDCKAPESFCTKCCAHYIGDAHEDNRVQCKKQCEDKRKGLGIVVKVPIGNEVHGLTQAKELKDDLTKKYTED